MSRDYAAIMAICAMGIARALPWWAFLTFAGLLGAAVGIAEVTDQRREARETAGPCRAGS